MEIDFAARALGDAGDVGFADACGVHDRVLAWDLPLPDAALDYARAHIPDGTRALVISACSSHERRNWLPERYAAVAAHAVRRHGLKVILAGGPGPMERAMADAIIAACHEPLTDQVGKDTLPQMLALLARAQALLAPDTGPAHMATVVGTPVVGLYACTNPARSGPYLSRQWCVDAFPQATAKFRGSTPERLPWATKIEEPGVMALISVEDTCNRLDALLASRL